MFFERKKLVLVLMLFMLDRIHQVSCGFLVWKVIGFIFLIVIDLFMLSISSEFFLGKLGVFTFYLLYLGYPVYV